MSDLVIRDAANRIADIRDAANRIAELEAEVNRMRRALDNIKIRGHELGQREMHDMALAALQESKSVAPYIQRITDLLEKIRQAHEFGYMNGVGDSEDYDHDSREMERESWGQWICEQGDY